MNQALLDDADRVVATDLYPQRCRTVISNLASALRAQSLDLAESRKYGEALVQELADRSAKMDAVLALAHSMDADFKKFTGAVEALGAMPEGYCFCSKGRIGDDSKTHEPECADIRALLGGACNGF